MAQRVTFYIDGFNFYYGLRRTKRTEPQWGDYYWVDKLINGDRFEVVRGKYLDKQFQCPNCHYAISRPDVVTDGIKRYEVPEKWRPANIIRNGSVQ